MTTRRRATRSLALGLGAALAFALTPAVATANEIVNGDFETGDLAGWNIYGGTAAVIDGAACLDVPAGIGPYGAAFQQRITLQPDTEYSLTFEAAVPSGTPAAVTAVVQLPRDPYTGYLPPQDITSELSPTPTGFEWSFQTPAELPPADVSLPDGPNASVEIQHTAENAEGYRLCLDDVVLEGGTDLVVNGGFDDGLVGWGIAYPEAIVNDAGEGCIVVPAGTGAYGAGLGQLVTLEPETDYAFSFTARLVDDDAAIGPIRAVVQLPRDPYTQYLPEQAIATVLTGEQQEFRFDFSTPADLPPADEANPDGPNAEMVVQQNGATVDGYTLCLDDVSLVGGAEPEPYTPDTGPRVRVNHVGYFTNGPKEATLVTDVVTATEWMLLDASDAPVATGVTTPAGLDDSAGLNVHTIDFGDVTQVGDDFVLIADGERSHPFEIGVDDVYERLRHDALNYYYPARSGIEIDGAIAGEAYARPAGHIGSAADETSPNQGDLDVGCQSIANQTNDAGEFYYGSEWACPEGYTLDVVGGWYDAGDHGKYVVNGGISVAQVMSVVERSKTAATTTPEAIADGTLAVPETGNGVPDALDEARWELEWMMTMQVPAGSGAQLIDGQWIEVDGMVHHKVHDEGWTGLPLMPHLDPQARSLHRPSTAATLNFAAVAAQGARLWAPYDAEFAADLLDRGRVAYDAAVTHPAVFATEADGAEGGGPYDDDEVVDEFYWAAAELFITTGDDRYGDDLDASPLHTAPLLPDAGGFGWGDVAALGKMNLATIPNGLGDRAALRQQVLDAADELLGIQDGEAFGHPYAGDADGEYVWGSNSQVLNNSVVLAVAFDLAADERYRDGVMEAMDYLLGRNALGWSYLTGYGEEGYNSVNQHSRWWSAQLDPALPNPPPGTISGGPNSIAELWDPVAQSLFARQGCAPQQCYVDDIGSWSTNELTINWNAPMAWVANFLADQDDGAPVEEATCRAHVREVLAFEDVAVLRVRVRSDERFGLWTLGWSFLGGEVVDWATGATVAQQGADVELSGVPSWWQHRRRSITTYVFVDRSNIAIGTPERIVLNGAACSVTIGGTGSRW